MGALIFILKTISVLLVLILLLLFSALAVPVRYRIHVIAMDDRTVTARFSWFFHFIHFRIMYGEKKTAFRLWIAGIPIYFGRQKAPEPKKAKRQKKKAKNSKIRKIEENGTHEEKVQIEQKSHSVSQSQEKEEIEEIVPQKSQKQEQGQEKEIQKEKKKHHASRKKYGVREILQGLEALRDNLRQRISDVRDKTSTVKEQILDIKKQISEETNKNAVLHMFRELKWLAHHVFPRKVYGNFAFGMADPSQTGQILGMLSALPFWAKYRVGIEPDFQAEVFYLKGELEIKGHIRACHFLFSAFRLFRDKNIKKLITSFRT